MPNQAIPGLTGHCLGLPDLKLLPHRESCPIDQPMLIDVVAHNEILFKMLSMKLEDKILSVNRRNDTRLSTDMTNLPEEVRVQMLQIESDLGSHRVLIDICHSHVSIFPLSPYSLSILHSDSPPPAPFCSANPSGQNMWLCDRFRWTTETSLISSW